MSPRRSPLDLGAIFSALADTTRRDAVALLGKGPRRASDLAEHLGASRPGMSRHLRVLREARIVREEADGSDGRAHVLVLDPAAFACVRSYLDEVEGFWPDQLEAFKEAAEARAREVAAAPKRKKKAS